jgi:hypothetical protein
MRPRIYPDEQLKSAEEGHAPWQDLPGNVASLDSTVFFQRLFEMCPPPARLPDMEPPIDRTWLPTDDSQPVEGVTVIRRHPEFLWDFLEVAEMHIGRSPRSTPRGFQNRFASLKSLRLMRAAANLEFDALLDCELDPIWLRYRLNGTTKRHKPDFFKLCHPAPEFWEVKYERDASRPENEERWPIIGAALNGLGYGYRVITERHLRRLPRWKTINHIYRDRHASRPPRIIMDAIRNDLRDRGILSVHDILARFPDLQPKHVHHLIRHFFLVPVSLDVHLDQNFQVKLGPGYTVWDRNALPSGAVE